MNVFEYSYIQILHKVHIYIPMLLLTTEQVLTGNDFPINQILLCDVIFVFYIKFVSCTKSVNQF